MIHGTVMDTLLTLPKRHKARGTDHKFVSTRAGNLRYIDTGGDKPVLMMTPDAPCVIEHHQELIELLSHNFRIVCFEMPGSGLSFPRASYGFTAFETANAMRDILDALAIDKCSFAMSCVNCLHAMNFSARFPERVTHLALVQIPSVADMRKWTDHNIPKPLRVPFLGQFIGQMNAIKLSDTWFSGSLPRPSDHRELFNQISRKSLRNGGCFCLASIVQGAVRTPDTDMLGASAPTDMVYGDKDYSHRHSDFLSITETVPQAKITEFSGCGHFPNLEKPEAYAKHICEFILGG